MATVFFILVTIVIAGWLWFYIVRPILEDYGVLAPMESVRTSEDSGTNVMSRVRDEMSPVAPSSLQTDNRQTDRRIEAAKPRPEELLTLYTLMRAAGIGREEARPALKAVGLPLDNNLWTKAAPPADDPIARTPIAQRPTSAQFQDDPGLAYQPPS